MNLVYEAVQEFIEREIDEVDEETGFEDTIENIENPLDKSLEPVDEEKIFNEEEE